MATKDIQFSITIDTTKAVKNMAQYRDVVADIDKQIKDLRKQLKEEGADTKTLGQEITRLTEMKKAYNKEIANTSREVQNNLVATSEKYTNTLKGMRAQLSAAKDALAAMELGTAEYAEQAEHVKNLNDEVKGLEQEYGVFTRSVGDYENAIKNALKSTSPMVATITDLAEESGGASTMITSIGGALKNVGKAGLALATNPVFLVLGGLAAIIMSIKKAINSSEEATARWNVVLAPLNRGLDWMLSVAQKAAGAVLSVVETASQGIEWLMGKLEHLPLIGDKIAEINHANKEAIQLEKDKYELTKRTREDEVANAKAALQVAKLRTQAKDKEKFTAAERLSFVQEAARIEEEVSKRNVQREREHLRIMEEEAARAQNTAEIEDALAQQRANVYRAEMEYYNKTRELLEQENTARTEMVADAKAASDKIYEQSVDAYERHQQLVISKNNFDKTYLYDYSKSAEENAELQFQHEQIWAAKTLQLQHSLAKQKLDLDLKYGKITQEQYNMQMQLMRDAESQFQLEQLADVEAHATELRNAMIELAGGLSAESQLKELESQYKQAFETLKNDATLSADERAYYEIKLTEELARKRAEILKTSEAEINESLNNSIEQRIISLEDWVNTTMEAMWNINDMFNALSDNELQKYQDQNEREKEALKKRLDAGIISQRKYDKEVAKLDEELDKKKAEIARKQAIREKALAIADIAWSTAQAIMNIWANTPPFAAPVMTALVGAIGAAQIATVAATPIPEARRGGLVSGATHEQGGVLINMENQERIISADPARAFPELLNLISYIGKHAQMPNTGYATRTMLGAMGGGASNELNVDVLAEKIGAQVADAIRQTPIYLSLTELREEQQIMAKIEESAKI